MSYYKYLLSKHGLIHRKLDTFLLVVKSSAKKEEKQDAGIANLLNQQLTDILKYRIVLIPPEILGSFIRLTCNIYKILGMIPVMKSMIFPRF